jgi:hypothetical protein
MLVSFCLGIVLTFMQDRCTVCAKHAICLEIILDAPDVLGDKAQVEARFRPFGDGANLDAR